MSAGKGICLVCGEPLAYFKEAQDVTCQICGKKETGHSVCVEGHYVCDACHRAGGVEHIMAVCHETDSKNPIRIAQKIMSDKSIYPNGPEHHTLIGASLMAAYKNAGGDIDLDKALAELQKRSLLVPGVLGHVRRRDKCRAVVVYRFRVDAHDARPLGANAAFDLAHLGKARRFGRSALLQAHGLHSDSRGRRLRQGDARRGNGDS